MQFTKRIFVLLLAATLLLGAIPLTAQPVQAAAKDVALDDVQYALLPLNYMNLGRSNTKLDREQDTKKLDKQSGHRAFSFDFNMTNAKSSMTYGKDKKIYAPFDMKVVYYGGDNHTVIVESVKPVRFANGTVDYMTVAFLHDNTVDAIVKDSYKNGTVIPQWEKFYDMGDYGNAYGVHLHMEVAVGKGYCKRTDTSITNIGRIRRHGIHAHEAFFVKSTTDRGKQNVMSYKVPVEMGWQTLQEISFDANGAGTAPLKRFYPVNENFGTLPTPLWQGKSFAGWFTDPVGGVQILSNSKVTTDTLTLYAHWKDIDANAPNSITMAATDITTNNAKLTVTADHFSLITASKVGFYLGSNPNYLTKSSKSITTNKKGLEKGVSFQTNQSGFTLQPDTTYYYQFYAIVMGMEMRTQVKSFKTQAVTYKDKGNNPVYMIWSPKNATGVTQSGATVSIRVSYQKNEYSTANTSVKVDRYGLYLGTDPLKMSKSKCATTLGTKQTSHNITYNLSNSGLNLQPGTTYYYQFYTVVGGKEYKSGIQTFTTKGTTPALNPRWSGYQAGGISQDNATLAVAVNYGQYVTAKNYGLYIGTAPNTLVKAKKTFPVKFACSATDLRIDLKKAGQTLQPGTTYYYKFYVTIGSKEYASAVQSFTTESTGKYNLKWSDFKASDVSQTNATIACKVNYGQKVKAQEGGFYLGAAQNAMQKTGIPLISNIFSLDYADVSFDLSQHGHKLKAGTQYYYQFYVVIEGTEYKSPVQTFTTEKSQQQNSQTTQQSQPTAPVLNPTWSKYDAYDIAQTNATITATVHYGKKLKADRCGFYLGTSKNQLTKATKDDVVTESRELTKMWFDLNKYGFKLKAGTTYYYQFYLVVDGKEYKSAVKSFATKQSQAATPALNPTWSKYDAYDITKTNATITATVHYGKKLKADRCGFYLGTSKDQLIKATKYDTVTESRELTKMWYSLNKYGFTLKAGTTYYYQFYLVVDGKEYKSAIKSFTTAK